MNVSRHDVLLHNFEPIDDRDDLFSTNFGNLCEAIGCNKKHMQEDIMAYGRDLSVMKLQREKEPLKQLPWHQDPRISWGYASIIS